VLKPNFILQFFNCCNIELETDSNFMNIMKQVSSHYKNEIIAIMNWKALCNKTQSQEVFKKYTRIFAISTKGVLGWELYEKSGINTDRLYDFL